MATKDEAALEEARAKHHSKGATANDHKRFKDLSVKVATARQNVRLERAEVERVSGDPEVVALEMELVLLPEPDPEVEPDPKVEAQRTKLESQVDSLRASKMRSIEELRKEAGL
jgi:hypothetical protein